MPIGSTSSPQAVFDPGNLAHARGSVPPQAVPLFDRGIETVRAALAVTLHDLFLVSAVILVVALIATLFLREVPLRTARQATDEAALPGPDHEALAEEAATA